MAALAWHALGSAFYQLIGAGLTLLPGPLAYLIYLAVLSNSKAKDASMTWRRIAIHVAVAFAVVWAIAYAFGQYCPTDDDGYCTDDDWKPPTSLQNLAALFRIGVLTAIGMVYASDHYKRGKRLRS